MHITIINDCRDENAKGRQVARAQALFQAPAHFIGVQNDLEAAGNILDILDAADGSRHALLVNVAPRATKSWWLGHDFPHHKNGTPFCHFSVGDALVLATVDGFTLSLVKKLGLVSAVNVFTYDAAVEVLADRGLIARDDVSNVCRTQFRSFNFLPRAAYLLSREVRFPTTPLQLTDIPDAPRGAWSIDSFGNVKTTLAQHEVGNTVEVFDRTLTLYPRLSDVPEGELAATVGSSGYKDTRFIEVVVQGGSAARELKLV